MTVRCFSVQGRHADRTVQCTYCQHTAAFHWTATYPDVLLCEECLDLFPEAQEARVTSTKLTPDRTPGRENDP